MKSVWIPEAPEHGGVYAPENYKTGEVTMTMDISKAMRFKWWEECQRWCAENPVPVFVPVEHGFEES